LTKSQVVGLTARGENIRNLRVEQVKLGKINEENIRVTEGFPLGYYTADEIRQRDKLVIVSRVEGTEEKSFNAVNQIGQELVISEQTILNRINQMGDRGILVNTVARYENGIAVSVIEHCSKECKVIGSKVMSQESRMTVGA